ncbi:MAG: leucine-rich repeat domain-containing protein, partial [Defluviitaleaceae bacterium]|nr:leucine-rich repeat domain-containing protein [Defluviitaleaceae bacterium]
IVLSNEVVYIGDGAFGYLSIESISLPESVRYIGAVAFTGPQRLYVPPIVMEQATISEHAFSSVWEVVVHETTDEAELAPAAGAIDTMLLGPWSMVMLEAPPGVQVGRDEQREIDDTNAMLFEAEITYSFNADGTGAIYIDGAEEISFNWYTSNDQLFILLAGHQAPSEIRFVVDEPRLTFFSDGESLVTTLARPDAVADIRPAQIDHEVIEFGGHTWIVLDEQDGKILILSEYILDAMPFSDSFNNTSWADSTVRRWLNDDFYNTFSEGDRARISSELTFAMPNPWWGTPSGEHTRDNIFLLSAYEVLNYFGNSGTLPGGNQILSDRYNSNRAARLIPELFDAGWRIDYWWTRTTGIADARIVFIGGSGAIQTAGQPFGTNVGIRPAMWIYR